MATDEYLTQLSEHIRFNKSREPLAKLEIVKVLLTESKAQLLAEMLSHPSCKIVELVFDRCRAKAEKLGLIFAALKRNQSIFNLTLMNMHVNRDSLTEMSKLLKESENLQMLTLMSTGVSDTSI